ncbi:arylesterase [Marimonas lutisalis]|uniref:arylesterase n=1 Tax=Marimonas lutisalis TaxID=2545756 RepID=UPI0010F7E73F|nr:arylesterase [Marimonas lutisalis]
MRVNLCLGALFPYGVVRAVGKALAAGIFALVLAGQAAAEKVHLIAFGDSLTAGWGLLDHEGFVPQLRQWLEAQGEDVRIVLAGVSGDTTAGGLARMDWTLTDELQGIILQLGGNDALRGVDPAVTRENLDRMMRIASDRGLEILLVGIAAPGNYGADYQTSFAATYPELAKAHDALVYPDFFAALGDTPAGALPYMQEDGIHPNAEGVQRIVGDIGPEVQALIARIRAGD